MINSIKESMNTPNADRKDVEKWHSLYDELFRSVNLITNGFALIQNQAPNLDDSFLTLHMLSSGFERIMKVLLCQSYLNKNGRYPSKKELKDFGHNLSELKGSILKEHYFRADHLETDYDFLSNSQPLIELLGILSDFGHQGRYYNFNFLSKKSGTENDPVYLWDNFKLKLIMNDNVLKDKLFSNTFTPKNDKEVATKILIIMEKFVWAISRQFIWGLGNEGRRLSPLLNKFYSIASDDFGKQKYSFVKG